MKLLVLALAGSLAFAQIPKGGGGSGGGGGGTGSANISTPFAAVTSVAITVTGAAATSLTDCYDNASPPVLIVTGFTVAVTNANTVTASWTGSKTGTCITNTSGINGIAGAAGASGPSGPSGPSGATGVTGSNGASGPSGPSGPTGVTGASGPSGPSGPSGASGPSGPQGTAGTNGTNGANGTGNNALCSDATGSGTTYTCPTPTPAISTLSGLLITFIPQTTNSGSATVNVSSLGAKTLKQSDCSTNLSASALTGGSAYLFSYNGTSFCQSAGAGGASGVTSVGTTGPITGGTITTTGTIACATCTTNASALTSNQLVFGAGSQATAIGDLTGDITTAGAKATTLATVNTNIGSFGDATHVGSFTVNGKGLITAASSVSITAGTGNAAGNVTTTFSATPTYTCGSATAGTTTLFSLSTALTANITSSTLATCTPGQTVVFHFVQDATGGRTVAMPTNWDALTVDGTASTATDALYAYDGTNGRLVSVNGKATPFLLGQAPERAAPTTGTSCGSTLGCFWFDSTNHIPSFKDNNSGTVSSTVVPDTGASNNFLTAVSASGVISKAQPAFTNISGTAAIAQGGTNGTDAADNGGIIWSNATGYKILAHTTTAGQPLVSGNAATPAWGTDLTWATHTWTLGASGILDLSAASTTAGLKIPAAAGAVPTADDFLAFNTTTHALVHGSNGTTIVQAAAATGTNTATTCATAGQAVTVISSVAVPTCSTIQGTTSPTAGTSISLTSGIAQMFVCTGTCTVTPPVPAAGAQYCVYNDDNVATVITMAAIGSSSRYENTARTAYGTAGTGTFVSGGAVGDAVCIVFRDSTHYSTLSKVGTWTAN